MKELYDNHPNVVPLIWQGDTINESPNYNQRASFYGVGGIPHAQFNGYLSDIGGGTPYPRYLNIYNNLINQPSPLDLQLELVVGEDNSLVLQTTATVTGEITTSNNKIVYLITRNLSDSYFSSVATYDDFDFSLSEIGEEETFEYELPINQYWTYEELSLAVLVQTWDNDPGPNKHKILQAAYYPFSELMTPLTEDSIDFGQVEIDTEVTETIQFTNYFSTPMNCLAIPVMGFSSEMMFTIEPFSTYDLEITFEPTQTTNYYGEMIITTDHEFYPDFVLILTGQGYSGTNNNSESVPTFTTMLQQNYPNPFNPTTKIAFSLAEEDRQNATLSIYNLRGKKIRTFNVSNNESGIIDWNGTDRNGLPVASGMYLYQLKTDRNQIVKKMILMK